MNIKRGCSCTAGITGHETAAGIEFMGYVTGKTVKKLREKLKITQKELAERINVSDKTISKWETEKGLPYIGILEELAKALGVSAAELLTGDFKENENPSGNMKKCIFMSALSRQYHHSCRAEQHLLLRGFTAGASGRTGGGCAWDIG